jgi:hypothetical protein
MYINHPSSSSAARVWTSSIYLARAPSMTQSCCLPSSRVPCADGVGPGLYPPCTPMNTELGVSGGGKMMQPFGLIRPCQIALGSMHL